MNWRVCFNPENEKELVKEFTETYGIPAKIYSSETGILHIMAFIYIYNFASKTYFAFLYNKKSEQVLSTFVNVMGHQANPATFQGQFMVKINERIDEIIKNLSSINETIIISKIKRIV
jgi:hypothetical protein